MVQINFARKEINCKLVYYGPGMSGKTTNLEMVHLKTPDSHKGELTSISTDGDRTLFFDFMPLDLGEIAGMKTKFHLYTVPGQVYYNSTRKLVLNGADGVIFVADSSRAKIDENLESLENLRENLAEIGKDIDKFPVILQWNKRDIEDAMTLEELEAKLKPYRMPTVEAIAAKGEGVFQTLKALSAKVLASINSTERIGLSGSALGVARQGVPANAAPTAATPAGSAATGTDASSAAAAAIERNEIGAAPGEKAPAIAAQRRDPPSVRRPGLAVNPLEEVGAIPKSRTGSRKPAPASVARAAPAAVVAAPAVAPESVGQRAPDVAMAESMARRAASEPKAQRAPSASLNKGPRVIGAPARPAPKNGAAAKVMVVGLVIAAAAAAATWYFVGRQ